MTLHRIPQRILFGSIVLTLAFAGVVIAQEAPPAETQEETTAAPVGEFEGTVKLGLGKFFYLPAAKGYDVIVQGTIQGQDASFLTDKEVRVKGSISKDEPQVFVADSIEVKTAAGQYQTVFTRTEEPMLDDYIGARARAEFPPVGTMAYNKNEEWEGKGKAKIYGQLVDNAIVVRDDKDKEVGKILVDNISQFASYYIKKLRLFDKFWFYINIKDTVDWQVRRRTRELFHADVVFAGLY
ncbi:MAG: hypothetical protein OEW18_11575 [Candidatus Aminicenantes bacterium]|nr:hypothetical protein [Candidatus Aminicenantes bacterium]